MTIFSPCDNCGKVAVLCRTEICGVETYACAECHGYPADEFDYLNGRPLITEENDLIHWGWAIWGIAPRSSHYDY